MRKNAGGLICTTAHNDICKKLDMPFLADVLAVQSPISHPVLEKLSPNDIPYDTKSAFSITINHRKTFTGITDNDRALTVSEFAKLAKEPSSMSDEEARTEFGKTLPGPGTHPSAELHAAAAQQAQGTHRAGHGHDGHGRRHAHRPPSAR